MARLAFLGTDTDVGKTHLAALTLRALRARGCGVVPFKPLASGSDRAGGDAGALWEAADRCLPIEHVTPWQFAEPVAPAFAMTRPGPGEPSEVPVAALLAAARVAEQAGEALLVETAGGLDSPVTPTLTSLQLADLLCGPLVLVALNRLGGIAAVLAAVDRLRHHRHRLVAVMLNDAAGVDAGLADDNERWLRRYHPDVPWFRVHRDGGLPEPLVSRLLAAAR